VAGEKDNFVKVPYFPSVPVGKPTKLTFQYIEQQAFLRQNMFYDIWVIKHSDTEAKVLSPLCTHLSCRYNWNQNDRVFACPCHGSVFTPDGDVIAGPAPRPLDDLPYKVQDGELYVNWQVFKPGIHQKVEI
jgi:menaquinol-cytochrome c reductase iron-sulfur subunit